MTYRPRKTQQSPASNLPALPMLLMELEASLPSLMAQPASFSNALARVSRCLDRASAPLRQRQPRAARPARTKAASADRPESLPLFS